MVKSGVKDVSREGSKNATGCGASKCNSYPGIAVDAMDANSLCDGGYRNQRCQAWVGSEG